MSGLGERRLGESGPVVGPMGLGTWAIGGPFFSGEGCRYPTGAPLGYGRVDDEESIRAIHSAVDLGAKLFDTADAYGTGHAERILGRALKARRGDVVIASKFGNTYDEPSRLLTGTDATPAYVRQACQASLQRLQTDWIDLYQLHIGDLPADQVLVVVDALEQLCDDGLIRYYGWSTDDPARATLLAGRKRCVAVQFDMNVFEDAPAMLALCAEQSWAGLARLPLAMGFLTGKFTGTTRLPHDDIRSRPPSWLRYFGQGGTASADWSQRLASIREILTSGGRSLAQGALAWIWARGDRTIPIPGFRSAAQVTENLGAIPFGPLAPERMREIDGLLDRLPAGSTAPAS